MDNENDNSLYTITINVKSFGGTYEINYEALIKGINAGEFFNELRSYVDNKR